MLMVAPAAFLWGAVYWFFGETTAAPIPWAYVAITLVRLPIYAVTRRYERFAAVNYTVFLILPFLLKRALGGFVAGSVVALRTTHSGSARGRRHDRMA